MAEYGGSDRSLTRARPLDRDPVSETPIDLVIEAARRPVDRRYGEFVEHAYYAVTDRECPDQYPETIELLAAYYRIRRWITDETQSSWSCDSLLLAGDYLYGRAFETAGNADLPPRRLLAAYRVLSDGCLETCGRRFRGDEHVETRLGRLGARVVSAISAVDPTEHELLVAVGDGVDRAMEGEDLPERAFVAADSLSGADPGTASDGADLERFLAHLTDGGSR